MTWNIQSECFISEYASQNFGIATAPGFEPGSSYVLFLLMTGNEAAVLNTLFHLVIHDSLAY